MGGEGIKVGDEVYYFSSDQVCYKYYDRIFNGVVERITITHLKEEKITEYSVREFGGQSDCVRSLFRSISDAKDWAFNEIKSIEESGILDIKKTCKEMMGKVSLSISCIDSKEES